MSNLFDNMTKKERIKASKRMLEDFDKTLPELNVVKVDISYNPSSKNTVLKILEFVDKIRDLQNAETMDISVVINVKQNQ